MSESYELLVCPVCGHRWLTIGAAAMTRADASKVVTEHLAHLHPGRTQLLADFVPAPPKKKPRPPSRRQRG